MRTIELPFSISTPDFKFITSLKSRVSKTYKSLLSFSFKDKIRNPFSVLTKKSSFSSNSGLKSFEDREKSKKLPRFNYKTRKRIKFSVIALVLLVAGYFAVRSIRGTVSQGQDSRIDVKDAKAVLQLNKEFEFPLTDSDGEEVSRIKYEVVNAELRDEIIVGGRRANSVKGRTFLIMNVKITNQHSQPIEISTRDYIRLSVNGSEEQLAPDIHNDPVSVQAISTKFTRLGMPINDSDTDLVLKLGEINGEKEEIPLNFK